MTQTLAAGELRSVDPATLEPVGSVPATPREAIPELVAEATLAQRRWAGSSHAERRALLARAAHFLLDNAEELARTITAETGKPLLESYVAELFLALEHLRWTAEHAGKVLAAEGIPFTQTVAAVAAGNAVVVKPSELTPLTGAWVQRAFEEAGAPAGLVRVAQGDGAVGETLVRSRGIAKVFFTGSSAVGSRVAVAAGERLCPVALELGGKDAMLVFDDADLDRAVQGALWGAFSNCGQTCASVERIYVARDLYQPFVEELGRRAAALRIGSGGELRTELGPLISEAQRVKVERLVSEAIEGGAVAQSGGSRPELDLPGWFYEPTVLTDVAPDTEAMQEEIFGPVVTVTPFAIDDEAIGLANDSPYGLSASIWTRDRERAARVASRLEAGTVWTNDVQYSYAAGQAPWGGYNESGFGRTHSKHGLYECSQVKFTDFDRGRVAVPWWYPYGPEVLEGFRGLTGVLYGGSLTERAAAAWRHRHGLLELGRRYLSRI